MRWRHVFVQSVLTTVVLGSNACGFGPWAQEAGGSDNLPVSGAGSYAKWSADPQTPADEPNLITDNSADLLAPTVLIRDDGGLIVWYERREVGGGLGQIWVVEFPALTELSDRQPRRVLMATHPWQAGDLRNPSVIRISADELLLFYDAGSPSAIGVARSTDDGETFVADVEPLLINARAPSVSSFEGETTLMFERLNQPGLFIAQADDNLVLSIRTEPVLLPIDEVARFDRANVGSPQLISHRTAAGQIKHDVFYLGENGEIGKNDEPESGIGHAAGFSLDFLDRSRANGEPILQPGAPYETSPFVILEPRRAIMLFSQRTSVRRTIAVAFSE